jgi:hypothetical protein
MSTHVVCALLCVGVPCPLISSKPRQTTDGLAACERCGRQLSKVKHHRPHGVGRACAPRCKASRHLVDDTTSTESSTSLQAVDGRKKRQRRMKSDPGQQPVITLNRLRVRAPKQIQPDRKKKKEEREAAIMSLLDETHARRMASLASAASATAALLSILQTHHPFIRLHFC